MGATDSKLAFRNAAVRLVEEKDIPSNEEENESFWDQIWNLPENASDVFSLLPGADVRSLLKSNPGNAETLIRKVRSTCNDERAFILLLFLLKGCRCFIRYRWNLRTSLERWRCKANAQCHPSSHTTSPLCLWNARSILWKQDILGIQKLWQQEPDLAEQRRIYVFGWKIAAYSELSLIRSWTDLASGSVRSWKKNSFYHLVSFIELKGCN